jgi:hypothetical protein
MIAGAAGVATKLGESGYEWELSFHGDGPLHRRVNCAVIIHDAGCFEFLGCCLGRGELRRRLKGWVPNQLMGSVRYLRKPFDRFACFNCDVLRGKHELTGLANDFDLQIIGSRRSLLQPEHEAYC